jgi:hypothetical protein
VRGAGGSHYPLSDIAALVAFIEVSETVIASFPCCLSHVHFNSTQASASHPTGALRREWSSSRAQMCHI